MARADHRWRVRSAKIDVVVTGRAEQWDVFDQIADRPLADFGIIVCAEHNEDANPVCVRTSILMYRWGRDGDAAKAIRHAVQSGLSDTTERDKQLARESQVR